MDGEEAIGRISEVVSKKRVRRPSALAGAVFRIEVVCQWLN